MSAQEEFILIRNILYRPGPDHARSQRRSHSLGFGRYRDPLTTSPVWAIAKIGSRRILIGGDIQQQLAITDLPVNIDAAVRPRKNPWDFNQGATDLPKADAICQQKVLCARQGALGVARATFAIPVITPLQHRLRIAHGLPDLIDIRRNIA